MSIEYQLESEHPLVGREICCVKSEIGPKERSLLNLAQNSIQNKGIADGLSYRLHNNSVVAGQNVFGDEAPHSAYFTLLPDGRLVVEWGKEKDEEVKLHGFLNKVIDYEGRTDAGAVLRSGHLAEILIPGTGKKGGVALLDCLFSKSTILKGSFEFLISVSLLNAGIIPLTTDGFPVRLY